MIKRRFSAATAALSALSVLLFATSPHAQDANEIARRTQVVARIGDTRITAGELEDKLAQVPRMQLSEFGTTPEEIRRKFLNDILVRDALLARAADDRHLVTNVATEMRVERALSSATLRKVRANAGAPSDISQEDVRAYYETNKSHFEAPQRVQVQRILCKTQAEAATVLDAFKKDPTVPNWNQLSRDHSQDRATFMRGGNLGFLATDGTSSEAGVKVDPSVVKAAMNVKDGELVPSPVQEGDMFGVIWRKGTVAATHRELAEVTAQIRDTIFKERLEVARKKLVDDLRAKNVSDVNEPLLRTIDVSRADGAITPRKRPGEVAPLGSPLPEKKL